LFAAQAKFFGQNASDSSSQTLGTWNGVVNVLPFGPVKTSNFQSLKNCFQVISLWHIVDDSSVEMVAPEVQV
jgi:hypothetical protein